MYYLLDLLLLHSLIGNMCDATGNFHQPHQTLYKSIFNASSTLVSNNLAASTSMHNYNDSTITSSANPQSQWNSWTSISGSLAPFSSLDDLDWPGNMMSYEDIESGVCAFADSFCSFRYGNRTIKSANPEGLKDMCILWDTSCSGNRTLAIGKFFGQSEFGDPWIAISGNKCYLRNRGLNLSDCERYNHPSRLSEFRKIKDWMRSPQCASARWENDFLPGHFNYQSSIDYRNLSVSYLLKHGISYNFDILDFYQCCGGCFFQAGIVDIYYWPEPDADTSCLSIIAQAVEPLDYGATIGDRTYLGCTGLTTLTGTVGGTLITTTFETSTVVTEITTIGSLLTKIYWYNPWSSGPCVQDEKISPNANLSVWFHNRSASIGLRDHSLILPNSLTQKDDQSMSSIVLDGFTL